MYNEATVAAARLLEVPLERESENKIFKHSSG